MMNLLEQGDIRINDFPKERVVFEENKGTDNQILRDVFGRCKRALEVFVYSIALKFSQDFSKVRLHG